MLIRLSIITAAFAWSSAAVSATPSKPLTAAHKVQIGKRVAALLKDPDSAKFKWPAPRDYGLYCGWVNAKNSCGGYTGFTPFMILGGVANGPKGDGSFLVFDTKLSSGDDRDIVIQMCEKNGFDVSSPPIE